MKNIDRYVFGVLFGGAFPFIFCLLSVVIWFSVDKSEYHIAFYMIAGLLIGLLIDGFENIVGSRQAKLKRQVLLITGAIMTLICVPTSFMAFEGDGVGGMIENILGLNFQVTDLMIWGIIIVGGISLIAVQMLLTRFTMERTINKQPYNAI